jgi:hypothetical protein
VRASDLPARADTLTCTGFVIRTSSAWHPYAIARYYPQLNSPQRVGSVRPAVGIEPGVTLRSCGLAADARTEGQTHEGCRYRRDEGCPAKDAQARSRAAPRRGRDLRGRRHDCHLQRQLDRLLRLERRRHLEPRTGLEHDEGRCVAGAPSPQRLGQRLGLEATSERALALNWPAPEAAPEMAAAASEGSLPLLVGLRRTSFAQKAAGAIRRLFPLPGAGEVASPSPR